MRVPSIPSRAARARRPLLRAGAVALAAILLVSCGGGGSSVAPPTGNTPTTPTPTGPTWTVNVFPAASTYAAQCASPRSGTDPATGRAFPDRAGSALLERFWLRSWTNDLYLWYSEVLDRDPALTSDTLAYFGLLKTTATTANVQRRITLIC